MALEDMVTFLVRFGFTPRYVLSRDLITMNALFQSAMRSAYIEKQEEAWIMASAIGEVFGDHKKKGPLRKMMGEFHKIISGRDPAAKKAPPPGTSGASEFMSDFQSGKFSRGKR